MSHIRCCTFAWLATERTSEYEARDVVESFGVTDGSRGTDQSTEDGAGFIWFDFERDAAPVLAALSAWAAECGSFGCEVPVSADWYSLDELSEWLEERRAAR